MKLFYKECIRKVDKIIKINNSLAFLKEDKVYSENKDYIFSLPEKSFLFAFNNSFYVKSSNLLYKFENSELIKQLETNMDGVSVLSENMYLVSYIKNNEKYLSLYVGLLKKWTIPYKATYSCLNHFVFIRDNYRTKKISKIKIKDGLTEWEFEGLKNSWIPQELYHLNGEIIIPQINLTNGKKNVIFTNINICTGQKIRETKGNGISNFIINKKLNNLYTVYSNNANETIECQFFNLNDGVIETLTVRKNIKTDIAPWLIDSYDDWLLYSDNINGCKIGVIDLSSFKQINEVCLNLDKGVKLFKPFVSENSLFVLDTTNTLHIFEKEPTPSL